MLKSTLKARLPIKIGKFLALEYYRHIAHKSADQIDVAVLIRNVITSAVNGVHIAELIALAQAAAIFAEAVRIWVICHNCVNIWIVNIRIVKISRRSVSRVPCG